MSGHPSFEFGDESGSESAGGEATPRPANDAVVDTGEDTGDNHVDRKPFPSGAELRATVCRAVWDAAVELEPIERAWDSAHRSDSAAPSSLGSYLAQLPTTNGEALRQFVSTGRNADGDEEDSKRCVDLTRSWSADPAITPDIDGVASIHRWQSYRFAVPTGCDSAWTSVWVIFDPGHSIDALNDFFDILQAHGASFELEVGEITAFKVVQGRTPSPEELLHLATARLRADVTWQGHAATKPWPGFMASAEDLVEHAGIILGEPFEAWCT